MVKCALLQMEKNPTAFGKVHLRNVLSVLCVCEKAGDHEWKEETKIEKHKKCRRYEQAVI